MCPDGVVHAWGHDDDAATRLKRRSQEKVTGPLERRGRTSVLQRVSGALRRDERRAEVRKMGGSQLKGIVPG